MSNADQDQTVCIEPVSSGSALFAICLLLLAIAPYRTFFLMSTKKKKKKNVVGYSLEVPRGGVSNEYNMFLRDIRKIISELSPNTSFAVQIFGVIKAIHLTIFWLSRDPY